MPTCLRLPLALELAALLTTATLAAQDPTSWIGGTVLDERGAPLAGVAVCPIPREAELETESWFLDAALENAERTDAEGRFTLTREQADLGEVLFHAEGRVDLRQSVELLPHWPTWMPRAEDLTGQVRTADGRPIAGARVVARDFVRGRPFVARRHDTQPRLHCVTRTDADGQFVLRGTYPTAVQITASALGYRNADIGPVSIVEPLILELSTCELVEGLVVDSNGDPLAHAAVHIERSQRPRTIVRTRTDENGRFACNWHGGPARATVRGHRGNLRCTAEVVLEEAGPTTIQTDDDPIGAAVPAPRLRAAPDPAGPIRARLRGMHPAFAGIRWVERDPWNAEHRPFAGMSPLDAEGRCRLPEPPDASLGLEIIVQALPRQGSPAKVVLPRAAVDDAGPTVIDASAAVPGRVSGRVRGPVPPQRLAVLSTAPLDPARPGNLTASYSGPLCPVAIDGSFEILEPPGPRILALVDIITGVLFARSEAVVVAAGSARTFDFEYRAHACTVEIEWAPDDTEDAFLEITPAMAHWPNGLGQIRTGPNDGDDLGLGCRVRAGLAETGVWLPPGSCRLALRDVGPNGRGHGGRSGATFVDPSSEPLRVQLAW